MISLSLWLSCGLAPGEFGRNGSFTLGKSQANSATVLMQRHGRLGCRLLFIVLEAVLLLPIVRATASCPPDKCRAWVSNICSCQLLSCACVVFENIELDTESLLTYACLLLHKETMYPRLCFTKYVTFAMSCSVLICIWMMATSLSLKAGLFYSNNMCLSLFSFKMGILLCRAVGM